MYVLVNNKQQQKLIQSISYN